MNKVDDEQSTASKSPEQHVVMVSISCLPMDVLRLILLIVRSFPSLNTIVRCKSVCKVWNALISDPFFEQTYFDGRRYLGPSHILVSKMHPPIYHSFKAMIDGEDPVPMHFGLLSHNPVSDSMPTTTFHKLFSLSFVAQTDENRQSCRIASVFDKKISCNGLVLYSYCPHELLFVSNPFTMEYVHLPVPPTAPNNHSVLLGFGFSPWTNQYKVLRLVFNGRPKPRVHQISVLTLGTGNWREITDEKVMCHNLELKASQHMTYLNGTLNWIANYIPTDDDYYDYDSDSDSNSDEDYDSSKVIFSFDMATEQFRQLASLPTDEKGDGFNTGIRRRCHHLTLGVYKDYHLCLVKYIPCDKNGIGADIWVLAANNFNCFWTKTHVFNMDVRFQAQSRLNLVEFLENGEILFGFNSVNTLLYIDPRYRELSWRFKYVNQNNTCFIPHTPRFVSLKDVADVGKYWKVMKAPSSPIDGLETRYGDNGLSWW